MKIQKSIVALANELLKEPEKFCSWGAEKIKIEENTMCKFRSILTPHSGRS